MSRAIVSYRPLPQLHVVRALGRSRPLLPVNRTSAIPLLSNIEYANRTAHSITNHNASKHKICLIIAAYNEELVLRHTIDSALRAGINSRDIYVVDDCSSDLTASIAYNAIGKYNVLTVGRSGKGLALSTIATDLKLTKRYEWIHIADADGEFDKNYFAALYVRLMDF